MVDRHKAVMTLYPNTVEVMTNEDNTLTAKDENGNIIELDTSLIENWQDPEEYALARQGEYASIKDQLDMMYHDQVDGTTTWKDHINTVKTNNPKPSTE